MRKLVLLAVVVSLGVAAAAQESRRTNWDGVFTEAQAERGERQYAQACAHCHSADLLGNQEAPALVGGGFMGRFDGLTVDDMVQTTRRTMPQEAPNSLTTEAYVDLISYVLKVNGSPAGAVELPAERAALKQVFISAKEAR